MYKVKISVGKTQVEVDTEHTPISSTISQQVKDFVEAAAEAEKDRIQTSQDDWNE